MSKQTSVQPASVSRVHSKKCSRCAESKPVSEFSRRSDRPGQYKSACKKCSWKANKKYWPIETQEQKRARKRKNYKPVNSERAKFRRVQELSAMATWLKKVVTTKRNKGIKKISLNASWIEKWHRVSCCPYTGLTFSPPGTKVNGAPCPRSPSLDRIDPKKGYTPSNTQVVSYFANVAKNAWPEEQFKLLVLATASNLRN